VTTGIKSDDLYMTLYAEKIAYKQSLKHDTFFKTGTKYESSSC